MKDQFPLDIEALQPGDVVTVGQIESITQSQKGSEGYMYALQTLRAKIEKDRKLSRRPIVLKQVRGELHVCTASEHLKVAKNRAAEAQRKLKRTVVILVTTQVSELTEEDAKKLDGMILNAAARLSSCSRPSIKRMVAAKQSDGEFDGMKRKAMLSKKCKA